MLSRGWMCTAYCAPWRASPQGLTDVEVGAVRGASAASAPRPRDISPRDLHLARRRQRVRPYVGQRRDLPPDRRHLVEVQLRPHDRLVVGRLRDHPSPRVHDHRMAPGRDRPRPAGPQLPAASTHAPLSIARARSSTSQWSRPVRALKSDGTASTSAPASASARYSSGNRRS